MRHTTGLHTLQEALQQMLQRTPYKHKMEAATLVCAWKAAMPEIVIQRTERVFYKEGKLFVKLNSSALRQALRLNKEKMIARLQAQAPDSGKFDVVLL